VNRFALSRAERSVHVLDKVRDHAPQTRERALQDLVARDGAERRRFIAANSGVQGMACSRYGRWNASGRSTMLTSRTTIHRSRST